MGHKGWGWGDGSRRHQPRQGQDPAEQRERGSTIWGDLALNWLSAYFKETFLCIWKAELEERSSLSCFTLPVGHGSWGSVRPEPGARRFLLVGHSSWHCTVFSKRAKQSSFLLLSSQTTWSWTLWQSFGSVNSLTVGTWRRYTWLQAFPGETRGPWGAAESERACAELLLWQQRW